MSKGEFWLGIALWGLAQTAGGQPAVATMFPPAGARIAALSSIQVTFNEAVSNVRATDLLVNDVPAESVAAYSPWQYVFVCAQPALGTVRVDWAADQNIHDQATNRFIAGRWTYTLDPLAQGPSLTITEFMAVNKHGLRDEDGEASGWIEIFNPTVRTVSLAGWSLTTQATNWAEWQFPNYALLPNQYLVVFASGKNRTAVTGPLHTNFRLPSAEGFIGLVDPRTNLVSSYGPSYAKQQTDVSYGCDPALPSEIGYLAVPTPGKRNAMAGTGAAPEVEFSQGGGTFSAAFQLKLSSPEPQAVIRYTLDGKLPTTASAVYTSGIAIAKSVRVCARAFVSSLMPGPIHSENYIQLHSSLVATSSDLPAIVIYNFGAGAVPVSVSQPVSMTFYEPIQGKTWLTNAPTLSIRAGIYQRGSSTLGLPKEAWAVSFWDELNDNARFAPLGLPPGSHWALYAPDLYEPVLIHNPLIYGLSNEIGRYAPRTRIVEVYLNTSGGPLTSANYNGIYVLEEKIERANDRVEIDELQPDDNTAPAVTGGYLMKIDRLGVGETGFNGAGQTIAYVDPEEADIKTPERAPQKQYLQTYFNSFGSALNGANYRNPTSGYAAYLDVDSLLDYHMLNLLSFNVDAFALSTFFYKPRGGKIFFGPLWDFDRSQGSTDGRDFNPKVWSSTTGADYFRYPWWQRLFSDIDFWQKWIDRYQDLRAGVLSTNHIFANIDELTGQVRQEQRREVARWPGFTTPRSGIVTMAGYSHRFPGTYQGEVDFLKQWYSDRLNFLDGNFLAKPVLSPDGGPITPDLTFSLSGPAGATLYYCTDGSDPRLSGGGISPLAQEYHSPVVVTQSAVIVARAYNPSHRNLTGVRNPVLSSPWSGVSAASFGFSTSAAAVAYTQDGGMYSQNFDSLPNPGPTSLDAANPVTINGITCSLANPFGFALPVVGPGGSGGLGLTNGLPGWYGLAAVKAKFGASAGDQSTGGVISFGPTNTAATDANRALGLLATSSTGPTAFGVRFINATGHTLNQIDLHFTGELWRQGEMAKSLTCSYVIDSVGTNNFPTNLTAVVPNSDVRFPVLPNTTAPFATDGTAAANQVRLGVSGFAITNWPPGGALWLVWQMNDPAAKGQGLAIDDLTFRAFAAPVFLTIERTELVSTVSWPARATDYVLESNTNLNDIDGWTPVSLPPVTVNEVNRVTSPSTDANRFYRLKRPDVK